ncbi:MAG: hypothetical protein KBT39_10800 [Bacteroidales bacterium]|nr:hypothetical protein [Bacteroidales bacterium]
MKRLPIAAAAASLLLLGSCSQSSKQMQDKIDSLTNVVQMQESQLQNTNSFIDLMNVSMDSVLNADGRFIVGANQEGVPSNAAKMKANVDAYSDMLNAQRERIAQLEQQIKDNNDAASQKMKTMIAKMKAQIDAKDAEIAVLREEIANNRLNIAELERENSNLTQNVNVLTAQNRIQQQQLDYANAKMSTGYYIVASKKELKNLGLLSGGNLLKKSKLDLRDVDLSNFKKLNIQRDRVIQIPDKSAKVLTQNPTDSYTLQSNNDGTCTLTINNAERFWSVSNYLVIQY